MCKFYTPVYMIKRKQICINKTVLSLTYVSREPCKRNIVTLSKSMHIIEEEHVVIYSIKWDLVKLDFLNDKIYLCGPFY